MRLAIHTKMLFSVLYPPSFISEEIYLIPTWYYILNGSIHNAELWQVSEQHVLSKDYILSFFNIYIIDLYLQNMCYL